MSKQAGDAASLLEVDRLAVTFYTRQGTVRAVREACLKVRRGELLGFVGESGSGKSTTAFAIMSYLPGTAQVDGSMLFEDRDVVKMAESELRGLRGNRMAMVYH